MTLQKIRNELKDRHTIDRVYFDRGTLIAFHNGKPRKYTLKSKKNEIEVIEHDTNGGGTIGATGFQKDDVAMITNYVSSI